MYNNPDLVTHDDGVCRCGWVGHDPVYRTYHDTEWGVPEWDSRALFEKLILDGFQAGLSWITILRKREAFRQAFCEFDAQQIVHFDERDIAHLMQDTGIVRNRAKIVGTIRSAGVFLEIEAQQGFSNYLWDFVDGRPVINQFHTLKDVPPKTPVSEAMSKDLKQRGFTFCGPTIVYAFMQAVGMVNDHLVGCSVRQEVDPASG